MKPNSARASMLAKCLLLAAMLTGGLPSRSEAKSYSSGGGHSYSSSSHSSSSAGSHSFSSSSFSHSSSSGGGTHSSTFSGSPNRSSSSGTSSSKSFSSGSGKSYSAGSGGSTDNHHGYTAAKSYTSGSGHTFSSSSGAPYSGAAVPPATRNNGAGVSPANPPPGSPSSLTFDNSAARARKEEASRQEFTRFKESSLPKSPRSDSSAPPSYKVAPPPLPPSASGSYRRPTYVPDSQTILTRSSRSYTVFYPYISRPVVYYRDPYNSFFWWWLMDRTLDDQAMWAYHHRYDMDPARYQALVANNQQLEDRVAQLEGQQVARDPNYAPPGLDRDLMYSDKHVTQAYSNRPTASGRIVFWALAIPVAAGAGWLVVWLLFYKRWQPVHATAT